MNIQVGGGFVFWASSVAHGTDITFKKVIESHSETAPSLRIDKPFPALLQYAQSLDLDALDPTDHGHVPYVILLVKLMEQWKQEV